MSERSVRALMKEERKHCVLTAFTSSGPGGARTWSLRYELAGRRRHMGLDSVRLFTLAEARGRARAARQLAADGIDPIDPRRAQVRRRQNVQTFKQCAESYVRAHEKASRNPTHRQQWRSTLATYAYPIIGHMRVADVEIGRVLQIFEGLWHDKTQTAICLQGRIFKVLGWATTKSYRSGENPARWKGHLDNLLPAPAKATPVRHHRAIPHAQVAAFMAQLRAQDSVSARALELTILTAARSGEVLGALWDEFDLQARIWTVPAGRMKAGKPHRVLLSDAAVAVLHEAQAVKVSEFVFPGLKYARPLSNMSMVQLMRRMSVRATPHGFRSCFKDWASESTSYATGVVEISLAHSVGSAVEQAYARSDLLAKRAQLMATWASYCAQSPATSRERVTAIREAAHGH